MNTHFLPRLSSWARRLLSFAARIVDRSQRSSSRLLSWSSSPKAMASSPDEASSSSSSTSSCSSTGEAPNGAHPSIMDLRSIPALLLSDDTQKDSIIRSTAAATTTAALNVVEQEEEGPLIPGLPDDLVLDCVLTRLSWQQLICLSSVSRGWRSMIQTRTVFESRIRTKSPQKLVVVLHKIRELKTVSVPLICPNNEEEARGSYGGRDDGRSGAWSLILSLREDDDERPSTRETFAYGLSLHNPVDNSWLQLPSISTVGCGIPLFSELACFKGRLFVLGGRDHETWQPRREVFMLDLVAGNGVWQERASMITPRASFGCGVIGNKLYVAGGHSDTSCALANAEVYDPELDVWEPIADMNGARSCCTVAIWEENMYVIGGYTLPGESEEERARYAMLSEEERARFVDSDDDEDGEWADSAEVFDSVNGEWRQQGNMKKNNDYDEQACTVFNGDLYSFSTIGVEKFDPATSTWVQMYKDSWYMAHRGGWYVAYGDGSTPCLVLSVAAVDNEIFAMVCMGDECDRGCTLLKSKGFGKPGPRLSWEKAVCPVKFVCAFPALCSIEV